MTTDLLLFQALFAQDDFGVGSIGHYSHSKTYNLLILAKDHKEAIEKGQRHIDDIVLQEMEKQDIPVLTYDGSINPAFLQSRDDDPRKLKLIDLKLISSDLII